MSFCSGVCGELRFDQPAYFIRAKSALAKLLHESARCLLCRFHLSCFCCSPASDSSTGGDKGADTVPEFEKSFLFELPIYPCDGVWIDDERLGQHSHARKAVTGAKCTRLTGMPDLLLQLEVDRDAGGMTGLEQKGQCIGLLVLWYFMISTRRCQVERVALSGVVGPRASVYS